MENHMELWGGNSCPNEIWNGGERIVFESLWGNGLPYLCFFLDVHYRSITIFPFMGLLPLRAPPSLFFLVVF